ncbi:unnamed protein product [Bemisia tabaci]|uniref:Protein tipE n=1 Tax=Bemisia tabaci TaxID=7038 RepID=A0A9P0AGC7_BEMTA|nr:PREDICTED: protein tipE [Bemisia tabaci]CAH0393972.1 unnamed protein product [Bemisia tabaci]
MGEESAGDGEGDKQQLLAEMTLLAKIKFYTSLFLGTTAILSVFAFLFLIPFVVDPAISTILADYDPEPITCMVTETVYAEGLSNCTWASCREGCTAPQTRCHQIFVNYSVLHYHEFRNKGITNLEGFHWDVADRKFLINTEGCGYPPRVNCSVFVKEYGPAHIGKIFPCYYSRAYSEHVVLRYSWDDNLRHLILSLAVPNLLFGISTGVLSYWYCPRCTSQPTYVEEFSNKDESEEEDYEDTDEAEY